MITIRRRFLLLPLILLPFGAFFLWLSTMPVEPVEPPVQDTYHELSSAKLWEVVNDWRYREDLPKYQEDPYLCEVAKERAVEIEEDFSHDQFEDSIEERYSSSDFNAFGENLARYFSYEEGVLRSWLDSPPHRKNLEADFTHSCIRVDGPFIVQIFAKY